MNTDSPLHVNPKLSSTRPAPSQERSRLTAERFFAAALKLLETRTFEALSVADIAKEAGRSVGAFYQRYGSKDDFLTVLLTAYFERRETESVQLLAATEYDTMLDVVLTDSFAALTHNRNLWHAALRRSAQDPAFWSQFLPYVDRRRRMIVARLGELRGAPLDGGEARRLGIALQVFNSVINNQMINGPGPLTLNDPEFLPALIRIFRAVYANAG